MDARPGVIARLSVRHDGAVVMTDVVTQTVFTIGRLPSSDLPLEHPDVAPQHAAIRAGADGVTLTDLGGDTGTMVDGVRLLPLQPAVLREFATIQIGPYQIDYRFQPPVPAWPVRAQLAESVAVVRGPAPPPAVPPAPAAAPPPDPEQCRGRYLEYLPVMFHENDFLRRFLAIFETIWEPLERRQDHLSMYFDPRTCPPEWLPWLAGWFGVPVPEQWPEARVRALIAEAFHLQQWRGTAFGLARMLEVCAGVGVRIDDSPGQQFVFRVVVELPADARPDLLETIEGLVMANKPAHAGYVIEVAS